MKIRFSVDLRELLDAEAKMALESRLPEFAAKTLEVSLRDRAESNVEALKICRLTYPSVGICVNENTPHDLMQLATEIIAEGIPNPAFFNDGVIRRSMERYGVPASESGDYINSTCVEITPCGASAVYVASPYYNLCGILLDVLDREYGSFAELFQAFRIKLAAKIQQGVEEQNMCRRERAAHMRRPLQSVFTRDCIERGKDIEEGGAKYNWVECSFVGLANLVDSLTVIRHEVFEKKSISLGELRRLCEADYAENESLRLKFLNQYPKYGQNSPDVDRLIPEVIDFISAECGRYRMLPDGSHYIPGTFCWEMHQRLGAETEATPDGRRAGFPFADGAGPAQGREKFGPTSAVHSVCSWSHESLLGGSAFNMKFGKDVLSAPEGREKLIALIKNFIREGGFQTQINVVDRETLVAADKNPDAYPDLVVRIGGYTDYFSRLSEGMRKEVLLRMQYEEI